MRRLLPALLLAAGCAGAAKTEVRPPLAAADYPAGTPVWNFDFVLAEHPLGPKENVKITTLAATEDVSIHLIQVRTAVPLHVHEFSDENIYLIRGRGRLAIGREEYSVGAGDVIHVAKGKKHFFENKGREPAVVLSYYTPGFRDGDRRWIE